MRVHGRVNLIAVAIVAAVAAGIYWVVMFSTVYLENLDVRDVVAACYNESGRTTDEAIRARIEERIGRVGTHKAEDGFGNVTVVRGLGLPPEQITVFRDQVRNTILIKVDYTQEVVLVPTKRIKVVHFVVAKEGPVPPQ
jgi:hypothetical protein